MSFTNYLVGFVSNYDQAATRIVFSVEGVANVLAEFAANVPELATELAESAEMLWKGRDARVTLFFTVAQDPEDGIPNTMVSIAPLVGPLPPKVPKVLVVATYGAGLNLYHIRDVSDIRDVPEVGDLTPKQRKTVTEMWEALERARNGFTPMGLEVPSQVRYFRLCKAPPPKVEALGVLARAVLGADSLKLRARRIEEERQLLVRELLRAHQDRLDDLDVDNLSLGEVLRYLEGGPVRARGKTYLLEGPPAIDQETYDAFCDLIAGI